MEFELWDIMEEVNEKNIDTRVKENIEYILKREGLWHKTYSIIFPAGGQQEVTEQSYEHEAIENFYKALTIGQREYKVEFYQFSFEIFDGLEDIIHYGTAYGEIRGGQMIDMTVELEDDNEKSMGKLGVIRKTVNMENERQQANLQDFATVDKFMNIIAPAYMETNNPEIKKARKAWARILSTFGELW